jgi:uncharacterized repeat protein (TIGR01451 family)
MMNWMLRNCARALAVAGLLAVVTVVTAQAQTPEGTPITNTATVTWTDANGNAYAPVSGSVTVTVGFQAGIDVMAGAATVSPASPSVDDTLDFDVANVGNGTDNVSITESISVGGIVTVTGYRYSGTTYGTLAALNTALSGAPLAQADTILIQVVYDVAVGQGGQTTVYTMTATSSRDGTMSDSDATTIQPPAAYAVTVTPDGGLNILQLPSNGPPAYQQTFVVTNTGNVAEDFDLAATSPGSAVITTVTVNGVAGTTTQVNIGSGVAANIVVEYTVADVPAGSQDTLYLAATSVNDGTATDDGFMDLSVIRPVVTIAKAAYRDDQSTLIGAGDRVLPGEFIQYLVTVTNGGSTNAVSVTVNDPLPAQVTYNTASNNAGTWSFVEAAGVLDATLTSGPLAPAAIVSFWIRVQIN